MFGFEVVWVEGEKHDGVKLKRTHVFSDTGSVVVEMLRE